MNMASLQARVSVPSRVLFRDLGGEAVLLEMDGGMYYGLNEVGTRIWQLLHEHDLLEPAFETLLGEYDVTAERLEADFLTFVESLATRRLLEIHEA